MPVKVPGSKSLGESPWDFHWDLEVRTSTYSVLMVRYNMQYTVYRLIYTVYRLVITVYTQYIPRFTFFRCDVSVPIWIP